MDVKNVFDENKKPVCFANSVGSFIRWYVLNNINGKVNMKRSVITLSLLDFSIFVSFMFKRLLVRKN